MIRGPPASESCPVTPELTSWLSVLWETQGWLRAPCLMPSGLRAWHCPPWPEATYSQKPAVAHLPLAQSRQRLALQPIEGMVWSRVCLGVIREAGCPLCGFRREASVRWHAGGGAGGFGRGPAGGAHETLSQRAEGTGTGACGAADQDGWPEQGQLSLEGLHSCPSCRGGARKSVVPKRRREVS